MRDGPLRRAVKWVARLRYTVDLSLTRLLQRAQGEPRYRLTGSCNGCGRCCEQPTIPVSAPVFHVRTLRWLALAWQKWVNGFEYVGQDRRARLFLFRCTHYDPVTKQCDSYESRPGLCRDYPRNLLYAARPEFFPECSFGAVHKDAARFRKALEQAGLPPEKVRELSERLNLKD